MNYKELRVGNLCEYDGKIFVIKTVANKIISADRGKGLVEFDPSELTPIKLSEKWMLKLGFEVYSHCNGRAIKFNHKTNARVSFTKAGQSGYHENGFIYKGQEIRDCEYVHLLQNLYFTLTGEELCTQ